MKTTAILATAVLLTSFRPHYPQSTEDRNAQVRNAISELYRSFDPRSVPGMRCYAEACLNV